MMQILKQELGQLDIASWANLPQTEFDTLAKDKHKFGRFSTWLLPQLVAWFGTWQLADSGREIVVKNCKTDHDKALYRLAMTTRSNILDNQVKNPDYGQLTPLVLLGFRRSQGINYEHWRDYPGLEYILEPKLLMAVQDKLPDISVERLLELQTIGLTIKSSTKPEKIGTLQKADSYHGLYGLQGTEIAHLDKTAQMIVCQTWLAHPKNRRETMILDLNNWDNVPQPLVPWQTVSAPAKKLDEKTQFKLAWATV